MKARLMITSLTLLAAAGLAGCEKDQSSVASSRLAKQAPWDAAANPFVVPGWTSGDKASWLAEVEQRTQGQNEFVRMR